MLTTVNDIPFLSPLAGTLRDHAEAPNLADRLEHVRQSVGLADCSGRGLLDIRGRDAENVLRNVFDAAPAVTGDIILVNEGALAKLRADRFIFMDFSASRSISDLENRSRDATSGELLTITDITHGQGQLLVCGLRAPDVLPKLCGLDFADARFPDLRAAQTSLAKVATLVMRIDMAGIPAYTLIVERSLTAYTWTVLQDAMGEFGGIIVDQDSFTSLPDNRSVSG